MSRRNPLSDCATAAFVWAACSLFLAVCVPTQAFGLGAVVYDGDGQAASVNRIDAAIWVSRDLTTITMRPAYDGRDSTVYVKLAVPEAVSSVYTFEDNGEFQRLHAMTSPRREQWEPTGECVDDLDEAFLEEEPSMPGPTTQPPSFVGTDVERMYGPSTSGAAWKKLQSLRGDETDLIRFSGSSVQNNFFMEVDTRRAKTGGRELPLIQFQLPTSALNFPSFGGHDSDTELRLWVFDVYRRWQLNGGTNAIFGEMSVDAPGKSWEDRYARMHGGKGIRRVAVTEFVGLLGEAQLSQLQRMHRPSDLRSPSAFMVTRLFLHGPLSRFSFEKATRFRDSALEKLARGLDPKLELEFGVRESNYRLRDIVAPKDDMPDCDSDEYVQWRLEGVKLLPFAAPQEDSETEKIDKNSDCKTRGYPCSRAEASVEVRSRTMLIRSTMQFWRGLSPAEARAKVQALAERDDVAEARIEENGAIVFRAKGGYWASIYGVRFPHEPPEYLIDLDERITEWNKEVHGEDTERTAKLKGLDVAMRALKNADAVSDKKSGAGSATQREDESAPGRSTGPRSGCSHHASNARTHLSLLGWILLSLVGMGLGARRRFLPRIHTG